jgi:hypothetical protein
MKALYHKRLAPLITIRFHVLGSDRPPRELAQYTGFLMNWCAERTRRSFMEELRVRTGLHPREFGLLSVLARH